jgi:biopolymer transport protein ExbD
MAGSQDPNENPVAINVVPMVDVIFCLCVFFMCSMKFKQMEGKFDSWLPKDKGQGQPMSEMPPEIRVMLQWDKDNMKTQRHFGSRIVADDAELQELIRASKADWTRRDKLEVPLIIDGAQLVPWGEVVTVINLGKRENIDKFEFAAGADHHTGK